MCGRQPLANTTPCAWRGNVYTVHNNNNNVIPLTLQPLEHLQLQQPALQTPDVCHELLPDVGDRRATVLRPLDEAHGQTVPLLLLLLPADRLACGDGGDGDLGEKVEGALVIGRHLAP